jgi:hypothetical protein
MEPSQQPTSIKSLWTILGETLYYYRQHGVFFTQVLLLPIFQITLAFYVCILLTNWLVNFLVQNHPVFVQKHPILVITTLLLIGLIGIFWVIRGGWHYLVYWTALNINACEAIEHKPINFKDAYQTIANQKKQAYKMLVIAYGLLPLLACLPICLTALLGILMGGSPFESLVPFSLLFSGLLSGTLLILWLVATLFLSFIFQIAAFEPISRNPIPNYLRSSQWVLQRFGTTLGIQVILLISTNYLLNLPIVLLFRVLRFSQPLDWIHQWLLQTMLEGSHASNSIPMMLQSYLPDLAKTTTDSVLMLLITALLLPLGTFAFTLLYRDITQSQNTQK